MAQDVIIIHHIGAWGSYALTCDQLAALERSTLSHYFRLGDGGLPRGDWSEVWEAEAGRRQTPERLSIRLATHDPISPRDAGPMRSEIDRELSHGRAILRALADKTHAGQAQEAAVRARTAYRAARRTGYDDRPGQYTGDWVENFGTEVTNDEAWEEYREARDYAQDVRRRAAQHANVLAIIRDPETLPTLQATQDRLLGYCDEIGSLSRLRPEIEAVFARLLAACATAA